MRETIKYSDSLTCNGNGTAQDDGSCQWDPNYYGIDCATLCLASTTCYDNGDCNKTDGSCICDDDYRTEDNCQYHKNCSYLGILNSDSCECIDNYRGDFCEFDCREEYSMVKIIVMIMVHAEMVHVIVK